MKVYELITVILGVGFLGWVAFGAVFESSIESPTYRPIVSPKDVEIREYDRISVVAVQDVNQSGSFRKLFNYISGNNNQQKKIPMTAPVIQDNGVMMFVLPENLTDIPTPSNPGVRVDTIASLRVGVHAFNGGVGKANEIKQRFENSLHKNGIKTTTRWFLCQYNSPWVFPAFRKNEIWIEVLP